MRDNHIKLVGVVETQILFSHQSYGQNFVTFKLAVIRKSGYVDHIPIIMPESILYANNLCQGEVAEIDGEIRSYNEGKHLKIFCYVKILKKISGDINHIDYVNELELRGFIVREPLLRKTPRDRIIADFLFAVNGDNRSDYLPCIAWEKNAVYVNELKVGSEMRIRGRFQSREYLKNEGEEIIQKTAFELSVNTLEVLSK